ncbi:MAG: type II toxin-antitoxin system RatA family toxin, partial [Alphaproteobacteria bacterium]
MLTLNERRHFPCSPQRVFDVVADVERYPTFLPGVLSAKVTTVRPFCFQADLLMGYKIFREPYRCLVHLTPYESITVDYLEGPFESLKNTWHFQETKDGVEVAFLLAFAFRSSLLQGLASSFSAQIGQKMIAAFEGRVFRRG